MSNDLLLAIGTLLFGITVWATLAIGYARFGRWYDRDNAAEFRRREAAKANPDTPDPGREPEQLPHDDVERLRRMVEHA